MTERHDIIARNEQLARDAKRILDEPILRDFFKHNDAECFEALKRLPMDASLSEFQVVQQALLAGRKLEITLKTYIEEYDTMALMDATGDAEGV